VPASHVAASAPAITSAKPIGLSSETSARKKPAKPTIAIPTAVERMSSSQALPHSPRSAPSPRTTTSEPTDAKTNHAT
jgi:hypothetical protein